MASSSTSQRFLAIGIDFGTTNCCVAIQRHELEQPKILLSNDGQNTTPSCVAYRMQKDENKDKQDVIAGQEAVLYALDNPQDTVFAIKSLIGTSLSNTHVQIGILQRYIHFRGFQINDRVNVSAGDNKLKLLPIAKELFSHLKKNAENITGSFISSAVVTVPVYYKNIHKQLIKEACEGAGLTSVHLIPENVAAALSYNTRPLPANIENKNCVIYDLGGQSFHVTFCKVHRNKPVEIQASGGADQVGGEEFANLLTEYCINEFQDTYGVDLTENERSKDVESRQRTAKMLFRIRKECGKQICNLSSDSCSSVVVSLKNVHEGKSMTVTITNKTFEDLIHPLLTKTIITLDEALSKAGLEIHEIDEIILIGGSTHIPKVHTMLQEYFEAIPVLKFHQHYLVAFGAAIYANKIFHEDKNPISVDSSIVKQVSSHKIKAFNLADVPSFNYTGRANVLHSIHTQMEKCSLNSHWSERIVVLHGPAGIGKTEVAQMYAHMFATDPIIQNVAWLDSANVSELRNSFLLLSKFLNIDMEGKNVERMVENIYTHFSQHIQTGLFIFDNAKQMRGTHMEILNFLPSHYLNHCPMILITTRSNKWDIEDQFMISMDVFDENESTNFLCERLNISKNEQNYEQKVRCLNSVADALENYPLGLMLAAPNILTNSEVGFEEAVSNLIASFNAQPHALNYKVLRLHQIIVNKICSVTVTKLLEDDASNLSDLLNIIACLPLNNITVEAVQDIFKYTCKRLCPPDNFSLLERFSIITIQNYTIDLTGRICQRVQVSKLVQTFLRQRLARTNSAYLKCLTQICEFHCSTKNVIYQEIQSASYHKQLKKLNWPEGTIKFSIIFAAQLILNIELTSAHEVALEIVQDALKFHATKKDINDEALSEEQILLHLCLYYFMINFNCIDDPLLSISSVRKRNIEITFVTCVKRSINSLNTTAAHDAKLNLSLIETLQNKVCQYLLIKGCHSKDVKKSVFQKLCNLLIQAQNVDVIVTLYKLLWKYCISIDLVVELVDRLCSQHQLFYSNLYLRFNDREKSSYWENGPFPYYKIVKLLLMQSQESSACEWRNDDKTRFVNAFLAQSGCVILAQHLGHLKVLHLDEVQPEAEFMLQFVTCLAFDHNCAENMTQTLGFASSLTAFTKLMLTSKAIKHKPLQFWCVLTWLAVHARSTTLPKTDIIQWLIHLLLNPSASPLLMENFRKKGIVGYASDIRIVIDELQSYVISHDIEANRPATKMALTILEVWKETCGEYYNLQQDESPNDDNLEFNSNLTDTEHSLLHSLALKTDVDTIKQAATIGWNQGIAGISVTGNLSARDISAVFEPRDPPPKNVRFQVQTPIQTFTGRELFLEDLHKVVQESRGTVLTQKPITVVAGTGGMGKTEVVRMYIRLHAHEYDKPRDPPPKNVRFQVQTPIQTFTGRELFLEDLHKVVQESRGTVLTQKPITVVAGTGGMGKTEVVRMYIRLHAHEYDHVIWIDAADISLAKNQFLKLANNLKITTDFEGEQLEFGLIRDQIFEKLLQNAHLVLIALDNADAFEDDLEFNVNGIKSLLPTRLSPFFIEPTIIVTSRNQNWNLQQVIRLDMWTEAEVVVFAVRSLGLEKNPVNYELATQLGTLCGHLPVAIQSAVAVIRQQTKRRKKYGIQNLIDEHQSGSRKILAQKPLDANMRLTHLSDTMLVLFNISFEKIIKFEDGELAIKVLCFMAYMSPTRIPQDFLLPLFGKDFTQDSFENALQILEDYSLITSLISEDSESRSFSIHRMIQDATIENLRSHEEQKPLSFFNKNTFLNETEVLMKLSAQSINYIQTLDTRALSRGAEIVENLVHITSHMSKNLDVNEFRDFTAKVANVLRKTNYFSKSIELYERVLEATPGSRIESEIYDKNKIKRDLAQAYKDGGFNQKSIELYTEVLENQTRVLGPYHRATLETKGAIAAALRELGKYDEAAEKLSEVLQYFRNIQDTESKSFLGTKHDYALLLKDQGKTEEALKLFTEVLKERENNPDSNPESLIRANGNIATLLREQGKFKEASAMMLQTISDATRRLGPFHVYTFTSKRNYAQLLCAQEKHEEAAQLLLELLEIQETQLGVEHPDTLLTKNSLAALYIDTKELDKAEALLDVEVCKRVFGPEHPNTMAAANNLATAMMKQEKFEEALSLYNKTLKLRKQVLGPNHPDTLTSIYNIGVTHYGINEFEKSAELFENLLLSQKEVLGEKNPKTIKTLELLTKCRTIVDERKDLILKFVTLTSVDAEIGRSILEASNWNMEMALETFSNSTFTEDIAGFEELDEALTKSRTTTDFGNPTLDFISGNATNINEIQDLEVQKEALASQQRVLKLKHTPVAKGSKKVSGSYLKIPTGLAERPAAEMDSTIPEVSKETCGEYSPFKQDEQLRDENLELGSNQTDAKDLLLHGVTLEADANTIKQEATPQNPLPKRIRFKVEDPIQTFTGRQMFLSDLHKVVKEGQEDLKQTPITVVAATGGMGKTQAVRMYIQLHEHEYDHIIWIDAENISSARAQFVELAMDLQIETDVDGKSKEFELILNEMYERLLFNANLVLLVLDGADAFEDDRELNINGIRSLLPTNPSPFYIEPTIIVTSRNRNWKLQKVIQLDLWTETEIVLFVIESLGLEDTSENKTLAIELGNLFGRLPIAIQSAVAVILDETKPNIKFGIQDLLDEYGSGRRKVLAQKPLEANARSTHLSDTLFVLWNRTMKKIVKFPDGELAIKILCFMAHMTPSGTLHDFLAALFQNSCSQDSFKNALSILEDYSLITSLSSDDSDSRSLTINRMIQDAIIENLRSNEEQKQRIIYNENTFLNEAEVLLKLSAESIHYINTMDTTNNSSNGELVKILVEITNHISDQLEVKEFRALSESVAGLLQSTNNLAKSIELYEKILEAAPISTVETEILQNIKLKRKLASAYSDGGHVQKSMELYLEVLENHKRALGPHHPDTIDTKCMIATEFHRQGNHNEAIVKYREVFNENGNNPDTQTTWFLQTKNNYACLLFAQGETEEALKLLTQVLKEYQKDPDLYTKERIATQSNIASVLEMQGKFEEASEIMKQIIKDAAAEFGSSHPSALTIKQNYAKLLEFLGKHKEAASILLELLEMEIEEAQLGPTHRFTLLTKNHLAAIYIKMREFSKAQNLLDIEALEKEFGLEHPETMATASNLALLIEKQEKFLDALALHKRILETREKALGPNHSGTFATLYSIGSLYFKMGESEKAAKVVQDILLRRAEEARKHKAETISPLKIVTEYRQILDERNDLVLRFQTITSVNAETARAALQASNWNVEIALQTFSNLNPDKDFPGLKEQDQDETSISTKRRRTTTDAQNQNVDDILETTTEIKEIKTIGVQPETVSKAKPMTTLILFRLADGTHLEDVFGISSTVQDLYEFVNKKSPDTSNSDYVLVCDPNIQLTKMDKTLEEANLMNATLAQTLLKK